MSLNKKKTDNNKETLVVVVVVVKELSQLGKTHIDKYVHLWFYYVIGEIYGVFVVVMGLFGLSSATVFRVK